MEYKIFISQPEITIESTEQNTYRLLYKYKILTNNGVLREMGVVPRTYTIGADFDIFSADLTAEFNRIVNRFLTLEELKGSNRISRLTRRTEERMNEKLNPVPTVNIR
jgi:hypothetical protein